MSFIRSRPNRVALAVLASAALAVSISLVLSPATASARGLCAEGQFCLLRDLSLHSGLYRFAGSDSKLNNDRFEINHTHTIVGNHSTAAWNRGQHAPLEDVVIYDKTGWHKPLGCIKRGHNGQLPLELFSRVESYQWVTDSTCKAAGVISLPGSIKP